jgi:hypothetical protein
MQSAADERAARRPRVGRRETEAMEHARAREYLTADEIYARRLGPDRHAQERRGNGRGPRRGALVLALEERHQLLL